jgi:hypothetical protein
LLRKEKFKKQSLLLFWSVGTHQIILEQVGVGRRQQHDLENSGQQMNNPAGNGARPSPTEKMGFKSNQEEKSCRYFQF